MKIMSVYFTNKPHPQNSSTETYSELRKVWNQYTIAERTLVQYVVLTVDDRILDSSFTLKFTDVTAFDRFLECTSSDKENDLYILVRTADERVKNTYTSDNIHTIQDEYKRWKALDRSNGEYHLYAAATTIASGSDNLNSFFTLASQLPEVQIDCIEDEDKYILQREIGADLYTARGNFKVIQDAFKEHAHIWCFTKGSLNLYKNAQHVAQGFNDIGQYIHDNTPREAVNSTEAALDEIIKLSKDSVNAETIAVIVNLLKEQK